MIVSRPHDGFREMNHRRKPVRRNRQVPRQDDDFLEKAHRALKMALKEEEDKGVISDFLEELVAQLGVKQIRDIIEDLKKSQEKIEKAAEIHDEQRQKRESLSMTSPLKESLDPLKETQDPLKEPQGDVIDEDIHIHAHAEPDSIMIADYLWRLFRILILACLVALAYNFVCAYPPDLITAGSNLY